MGYTIIPSYVAIISPFQVNFSWLLINFVHAHEFKEVLLFYISTGGCIGLTGEMLQELRNHQWMEEIDL